MDKERSAVRSAATGQCLRAYAELMRWEWMRHLPAQERAIVQTVFDRLRAHLKFLGETV